MRPDMGRLIIEDGRHGGYGKAKPVFFPRREGEEFENYRAHEPMGRHWLRDGKSLGDRLAPLRKYLEAQVGRPWNKVYSEICEANDRRTIRGYHLMTHLKHYVLIGNAPSERYMYQDFLVGPDGILKRNKRESYRSRWRKERKAAPVTVIKLDDGWEFRKIENIWYRVHIKMEAHTIPGHFKVRTYGVGTKYEWEYKTYIEAKTTFEPVMDKKFQCGKKELKQINKILAEKSGRKGLCD
jgi:hypothetical protein